MNIIFSIENIVVAYIESPTVPSVGETVICYDDCNTIVKSRTWTITDNTISVRIELDVV